MENRSNSSAGRRRAILLLILFLVPVQYTIQFIHYEFIIARKKVSRSGKMADFLCIFMITDELS